MAIELIEKDFEEKVVKSTTPVLVDFYAPWCGPCQTMGPVIDELAEEVKGKFDVFKVNVDESPSLAEKYGVMSIPSIKIFKNGQVVKEFTGAQSKMILKSELEKA